MERVLKVELEDGMGVKYLVVEQVGMTEELVENVIALRVGSALGKVVEQVEIVITQRADAAVEGIIVAPLGKFGKHIDGLRQFAIVKQRFDG